MKMNFNVQPTLVGATDPTPPGLDPAVIALAKDPQNLESRSAAELEDAFAKAKNIALEDAMRNRRVVEKDGKHYWAAEYPNTFTFDGQIRAPFEEVSEDSSEWTPAQQTAAMRSTSLEGKLSDVIIETDDGESVIIRKRKNSQSANEQEFDLISTVMARQAAESGAELKPKIVSTAALAGVAIVPGLPMKLGLDPATNKAPRTQGNVVRITGLQITEKGEVGVGHPDLKKPEKQTDAREKFNNAIRAKRSATLGSAAIRS